MPTYCCVPGCTNALGGHKFPQESSLKLKWRVAVNRLNVKTKKLWDPPESAVVCRIHFKQDDYKETLLGKIR